MNYGNIKLIDTADGEGVRVGLYVSGCRNHCKGCHNPETWNFDFGKEFTDIEMNEILEGLGKSYISGLSILGGEPFEEENQPKVLEIIENVKKTYPSKTIWMYSGYYIEDLKKGGRKFVEGITDNIINNIDVLVDSPFVLEQRNLSLAYRGSENQRVIRLKG